MSIEGALKNFQDTIGVQGTNEQRWVGLDNFLSKLATPMTLSYKHYTADGVADMTKTLHMLDSGVDITAVTPAYIGQVIIVVALASGTDPTATTGAGVTWEGTNDVATFPDADDLLFCVATSLTRWHIVANVTGVSFS